MPPCQVFRTYNASIVLQEQLARKEESSRAATVDEKKAEYDLCNKEVAILCNHQRAVAKTHGNQVCGQPAAGTVPVAHTAAHRCLR